MGILKSIESLVGFQSNPAEMSVAAPVVIDKVLPHEVAESRLEALGESILGIKLAVEEMASEESLVVRYEAASTIATQGDVVGGKKAGYVVLPPEVDTSTGDAEYLEALLEEARTKEVGPSIYDKQKSAQQPVETAGNTDEKKKKVEAWTPPKPEQSNETDSNVVSLSLEDARRRTAAAANSTKEVSDGVSKAAQEVFQMKRAA